MNPVIAEKTQVTYKELMTLLNAQVVGKEVAVEYNTVRNFNLDEEIKNLASDIKDMSVSDIYEGAHLENKIETFFKNNIHGERKNENYNIRKDNSHVEFNDAGFMLFDSAEGIRSVYVRNIISVTIDGVKYSR